MECFQFASISVHKDQFFGVVCIALRLWITPRFIVMLAAAALTVLPFILFYSLLFATIPGELVCLGDNQHLRSVHGTGFLLEASFKHPSQADGIKQVTFKYSTVSPGTVWSYMTN